MILPQCQIFPISVPGVQNGHLGDHARFLRRLRVVVFFRDANGKHPRPVPGIVVRPKHFPRGAFGVQFRFHEARRLPDVSIFNRRVLLLQRFNFFCLVVLEENEREKKNQHFKKPPKRNDDSFEKPFSLGVFHRANEFSQLFFFVSLFVCTVFVVVSAALVLGHLLTSTRLSY